MNGDEGEAGAGNVSETATLSFSENGIVSPEKKAVLLSFGSEKEEKKLGDDRIIHDQVENNILLVSDVVFVEAIVGFQADDGLHEDLPSKATPEHSMDDLEEENSNDKEVKDSKVSGETHGGIRCRAGCFIKKHKNRLNHQKLENCEPERKAADFRVDQHKNRLNHQKLENCEPERKAADFRVDQHKNRLNHQKLENCEPERKAADFRYIPLFLQLGSINVLTAYVAILSEGSCGSFTRRVTMAFSQRPYPRYSTHDLEDRRSQGSLSS
uniref:Uncharacterized protein n=1 Tax=Brassica campestris TaxID=3711 RepID=A0A3P5Z622_BRACM|nr:unnamed protein product [Brassica rapa]